MRTSSLLLLLVSLAPAALPAQTPEQAFEAMLQAAKFFRDQVSTEGGYHFRYAEDLSFGRSEQALGPTQISVQRDGTPRVALAYLEAWRATDEKVFLDYARDAAHALVRGQLCSGGWPYVVEFDSAKRNDHDYRIAGNCADRRLRDYTTLDDNVSQAALRVVMRVDRALDFSDPAVHQAALAGLDGLLEAQYPNGAWPQRFVALPDMSNRTVRAASYPDNWPRQWPDLDYRDYYTLNDNTLADIIDAYLEAYRIYGDERYLDAAKRGGEFCLRAQMPEPQPAWAQQYDLDMHPAWARQFEPPSVTGGESQSVLRILLTLYRETGETRFLEPVPRALAYLKASALESSVDDPPRKRRTCPPGSRCLARFYELRTNKPLYVTKGDMIRGEGVGLLRPNGYELSYDGADGIRHYSLWSNGDDLDAIEAEYRALQAAAPGADRRPVDLHGLSPWREPEDRAQQASPTSEQVSRILSGLDARGAWIQDGFAGRSDQVVSVYAAAPMVVRIGGRLIPLPEDGTVEVFRGAAPTVERMIVSSTFARNLETLARFVASAQ